MDATLTDQLRAALSAFVTESGTRRSLPCTVRLGVPGGEHLALPHDPTLDAGLRSDVLERALDTLDPSTAVPWLTRSGDLVPGDIDFAWFTAAREAFSSHGYAAPGFFVMNRYGWLNLVDDTAVRWSRVRVRTRRR
ncbi:MAG: hypothetical protein JWQ74_1036 [Marmoricola sp.]|nr:hypothetical protein [Marmoricola sp.]